jgi:hypothetical protein
MLPYVTTSTANPERPGQRCDGIPSGGFARAGREAVPVHDRGVPGRNWLGSGRGVRELWRFRQMRRPGTASFRVFRWGGIVVGVRAWRGDSPGSARLDAAGAGSFVGARFRGKRRHKATARPSQSWEGWVRSVPTNLRQSNAGRSMAYGPVVRGSPGPSSAPSPGFRGGRPQTRHFARSATQHHDRKPRSSRRATRERPSPAR